MLRAVLLAVVGCVACAAVAVAEEDGGPTYQRHSSRDRYHRPRHPKQFPQPFAPQFQSGSFQRPYPYHLDYYKKVYGGGYEPYLGNLYGPPQFVGKQPFAFSEYPATAEKLAGAPPVAGAGYPPPWNGPYAAPMIECPHCQRQVQLLLEQPTPPSEPAP